MISKNTSGVSGTAYSDDAFKTKAGTQYDSVWFHVPSLLNSYSFSLDEIVLWCMIASFSIISLITSFVCFRHMEDTWPADYYARMKIQICLNSKSSVARPSLPSLISLYTVWGHVQCLITQACQNKMDSSRCYSWSSVPQLLRFLNAI